MPITTLARVFLLHVTKFQDIFEIFGHGVILSFLDNRFQIEKKIFSIKHRAVKFGKSIDKIE